MSRRDASKGDAGDGLFASWTRREFVRRAALAGLVGTVGGSWLLEACSSAVQTAKSGGVLRIGTTLPIDTMNIFTSLVFNTGPFLDTVAYPELIEYDQKIDFVPDWATKWEGSSDGTIWTFHLRPNTKWSDGQPMTADDAAWTWNLYVKYQDTATDIWGPGDAVVGATALDPVTVQLHFSKPFGNALTYAQGWPLLPRHVLEQYVTGDAMALKNTFTNIPTPGHPSVSGGPFMLTEYKQDEIALFARNPYYYGRRPYADGFGVKTYANDDAMVAGLKNGEIDFIQNLPATAFDAVKSAGFEVSSDPGLSDVHLIFNSNPNKPKHRELLDKVVRQAFEYAIDRAKIVEVNYLSHARPGASFIPPASVFWSDPSIKPLPFDLARAAQILDQAGYTKGPDGVRVAKGGPMAYNVMWPNKVSDRIFEIIQPDFASIGIKLTQQKLDNSAWGAAVNGPNGQHLDADLAVGGWGGDVDPNERAGLFITRHLKNSNYAGYSNPAYDDTFAKSQAAVERNERQRLIYQLQQIVAQDRPWIVLAYPDTMSAWSKKWTGFVASPQGIFNYLTKATFEQMHQVG